MSKEYERAHKILAKEFGKVRKMYLATCYKDIPKVRLVTTYYCEGSFYLVTHESSEKVQQINKNKNVILCTTSSCHKLIGEAINIGHPLKEENKDIRDLLINAFSDGYSKDHDESDPNMCFVHIKINTAFTYANKIGYNVDFRTDEVKSFPFTPFG